MKHIRVLNRAGRPAPDEVEAQALVGFGCTTIFEPGWETDGEMGFAGLCRPMQRDVFGCAGDCWWPAQVPDELTLYPGWLEECQNVEKDWKDIRFVR